MNKITKNTIIGDIIAMDSSLAKYFLEVGMHCIGCPAARGETLEQACEVHGIDCDSLLATLNANVK